MYARYNNYTSCPVSKFELPTKARQFFGSDSVVQTEMPVKESDSRIPTVKQSKSGTRYNHTTQMTERTEKTEKMNKQQQTVLNMAGFIKSQSLTLLEKLDALDADEQAAMCEKLHELAEELQNSIQTRFEVENNAQRDNAQDRMPNGTTERKEKMSHKALLRFLAH